MFVLFSESWTQWPFWTGPHALQGSVTLLTPPSLLNLSQHLVFPRCALETGPLARVVREDGRQLWGDTLPGPFNPDALFSPDGHVSQAFYSVTHILPHQLPFSSPGA